MSAYFLLILDGILFLFPMYYYLHSAVFPSAQSRLSGKILKVFCFLIHCLLLILCVGSGFSGLFISVIFFFIFARFLFLHRKRQLLYDLIYILCFLCTIQASIRFVSFVLSLNPAFLLRSSENLTLLFIFAKTFSALIMTRFFLLFLHRGQKKDRLTRFQIFSIFLVILLSLILFVSLISICDVFCYLYDYGILITGLIALLILFLNFYVLYMIEVIGKNNALARELALYQQQSDLQLSYYRQLEEKLERSRKIIHDIRNHLNAVEALYASGNREAALGYATDIHDLLNMLGQKFYSGSPMLNIILNDKAAYAHSLHIQTDFSVCTGNFDFIKDIDVTTIFANLLDNAITASREYLQKNPKDSAVISLRLEKFHDLFAAVIKNPSLSLESFRPGIGLKNVENTLKRYGGSMELQEKDGIFCVSLWLPAPASINKHADEKE